MPDHTQWLPITGYDGFYEVRPLDGLVRSLDRTVTLPCGQVRSYKGRVLKWNVPKSNGGYPAVALSRPGQEPETVMVHRIVLREVHGECPEGQESRHGPNGKLDPGIGNLCYGTRAQNIGPDRLRDGQDNRGEKHGLHKLTADDVRDIRARRERRESLGIIAALYDISIQTVSSVATRRTWAWLD